MNFNSLRYYIIFMRYKRSGSALLVNLIDAHPQAIFVRSEEFYAKYTKWEEDPKRLYSHLYNSTKRYKDRPFSANGYKYPIDGVGFAENPIVIGHKSSTRRFLPVAEDVSKLMRFQKAVDLPLKFLHLVRSPYDQVNARWQQKEFRRPKALLGGLIEHVREQTEGNAKMQKQAGREENYLQVHYEDLKVYPMSTMAMICDFLSLPVLNEYLSQCDQLVFQTSEKEATTWTDTDRALVRKLCEDYPKFYGRYL